MESNATPAPSKPKLNHKPKQPENANPNFSTTKSSKSTLVKSDTKVRKTATKKPVPVASPSPKSKIRDRKFVVAKKSKNPKGEKLEDSKCKCEGAKKCVCVAYVSLRASQDEFTKTENVTEKDGLVTEIGDEKLGESEKVSERVKRRREKLLEVARGSIPDTGCGRVMHLVKAFENALTLPKEESESEEGGEKEKVMVGSWELPGLRPRAPVTEFSSPEILLTRESLGLDPRGSSSSGSISRRESGGGGRHSRRNSAESSATMGGSRGKRRTNKATPQQPFELKTEIETRRVRKEGTGLRASQDEFTKTENVTEKDGLVTEIGDEKLGESEKVSERVKRRREKLLEVARGSIPDTGCGRVMHLVKAFENALTLPKEESESEEGGEKEKVMVGSWELPGLRPRAPVTEFSSPEILLTRESLGLDPRGSSSSGSISRRESGGGGRHSRRNSAESSATMGGSRGKRRTNKATPQQPFELKTEQRGRSKQEEFVKKVQEMMAEQERQRIRVAQGLPWTTDEPECLAKPPVKDCTRPVDLVLHSDMRAMERAEFDHLVLEKLSAAEQYKLERERQQKLEEEEELRRLRKELVPKAQPMPYFDRPFVPKRSEKQPTMPKEPKFHNPQNKKMPAGQ
nr:TPX2 (targeting protein for Xklp2) protein family [Tanacetum cinerariifolium]